MDPWSIFIGSSIIAVALALIGTSIPLVRGRVKRNRWYGVRLKESLASDAAWVAINRYGAWLLIRTAVAVLAIGIATLWVPIRTYPLLALLAPVAGVACLLAAFARIVVFAARYEAAHPETSAD